MVVAVTWIDEVFGDDVTAHLETRDKGIETTTHTWTREATKGAELTGDETAMLMESGEDGVFDGAWFGSGVLTATIVAEVCPPFTTDKSCFLVEELAIHAVAFCHNGSLPLP